MKLSAECNDHTCIDRVGADVAITHDRARNPERECHAAAIDHPIKDACQDVSDGKHLLSRKESSQYHTSMYVASYIYNTKAVSKANILHHYQYLSWIASAIGLGTMALAVPSENSIPARAARN